MKNGVSVNRHIYYQRNRLTSKVGLFDYQVLNGKLIVPAGCENSSVRYCSVSIPVACAFAIIKYRVALHAVTFAVL